MTVDDLVLDGTTYKVALKLNAHDQAQSSYHLINERFNDFLIESESHRKKIAFDGDTAPRPSNLGGLGENTEPSLMTSKKSCNLTYN